MYVATINKDVNVKYVLVSKGMKLHQLTKNQNALMDDSTYVRSYSYVELST